MTGRAGRGDKPGRALLQTFQPDHPVIAALVSGDRERFYDEEIAPAAGGGPAALRPARGADRRRPPTATAAEAHARGAGPLRRRGSGVAVLGPAEAPLAVLRGRHRFRLLVKTGARVPLQDCLRAWLAEAPKPPAACGCAVDVDPMSFL